MDNPIKYKNLKSDIKLYIYYNIINGISDTFSRIRWIIFCFQKL